MNTNHSECVAISMHNHIGHVCQNVTSQAELLINYIKEGLLNNEGIIVIARPTLRKIALSKLDVLGVDSQLMRYQGQVKLFDAEFLLSNILIDGVIDEQAFWNLVGIPMQAAQSKFGKVRAFAEMEDILWQRDLQDTAIQLVNLWKDLCDKHSLKFLCSYLLDSLDHNDYDSALEKIYKHHTYLGADSFNPDVGETLQEAFGAAWNRVMDRLTKNHQIPQASLT